MNITNLTATDIRRHVVQGDATAEAITAAFLSEIRLRDRHYSAFLHLNEDAALEAARAVDLKRRDGQPLGRLAGVPVAIKDAICTKGMATTCGSKMLRNFIPPYDAHVVELLKAQDAVVIGKTNMDEFAMGSSTENSAFGITRNPWNLECVPGGSSGGSAAAVASGFAPLALGSDTGGSVRQPAAFCGVTGLKPSYGRISRYGLIAFASSLDQIGTFSRGIRDAALLLGVIAGHDERDATSVAAPVPDFATSIDTQVQPLRIGVVREHFAAGLNADVDQAVRAALKVLQHLGAEIRDVALPHIEHAVAVYYVVATAEASSNLARYDGTHFGHRAADADLMQMVARTRGEAFGAEVKRRIMLGTYALSTGYKDAYYVTALRVRRLISQDFEAAFQDCDVIVSPTSPTPAFKIGEKTGNHLSMYLSDVYTIGANLAGIAGISIPCGFSTSGLPIGMQILTPTFAEEKLLRVGLMYENETDWHTRLPPAS